MFLFVSLWVERDYSETSSPVSEAPPAGQLWSLHPKKNVTFPPKVHTMELVKYVFVFFLEMLLLPVCLSEPSMASGGLSLSSSARQVAENRVNHT